MAISPTSFAQSLSEAYKNYQAPRPIPSLNVEPIQNKTWTVEHESNDKLEFKWMFYFLTFTNPDKGSTYREFEANILDTSTGGKRSFSICLKDTTTDDYSDSTREECYGLNLDDYIERGVSTTFKILKENADGSATIIGEVGFPK